MSDVNTAYLEIFPKWLGTLGEDLATFVSAVKSPKISDVSKRYLLGGMNYLFKSLDLIPDGIEDIGYLDDAFVLRLSAKGAMAADLGDVDADTKEKLSSLAKDCPHILGFLTEPLYRRLEKYTDALRRGAARGRMVEDLAVSPSLLDELLRDATQFIQTYQVPKFAHDEKNLIKMSAFFEAKLPK